MGLADGIALGVMISQHRDLELVVKRSFKVSVETKMLEAVYISV